MTDPVPEGQADLLDQWLARRGPAPTAADTAPADTAPADTAPQSITQPTTAPPGRRRAVLPDTPPVPADPTPPTTAAHEPPPEPPPEPERPDRPAQPAHPKQPAQPTHPAHPAHPAAVDADLAHPTFRPRTAARRVIGVLLVVSLALTALLAWQAYAARVGLAAKDLVPLAIAAALSLALWAVRSSTSVVRLRLEGGQLTISRDGGDSWRCDLASTVTPIEVVGTPGRRGWKVVFARRGRAPYVVDASVVDPVHFTRVLAHYRPDVTGPP